MTRHPAPPMDADGAACAISFLPGGNAAGFTGAGWSFPEPHGTWTVGGESEIRLPALADAPHRLELAVRGLVSPPQIPRQRVRLRVNGWSLPDAELTTPDGVVLRYAIRADRLHATGNLLVVSLPDCVAPAGFWPAQGDHRRLGLCVSHLRLRPDAADAADAGPVAPADPRPHLVLFRWSRLAFHLAAILEAFPPFDERVELRFTQGDASWSDTLDGLAPRDRARLLALWEEADHDRTAASSPPHPLVRIPRLSTKALWPLRASDPGLRPEPPDYPDGRYPFADRAAVAIASDGRALDAADDDGLFARYLGVSEPMLDGLEATLAADLASWERRDRSATIATADFLAGSLATLPLFHAPATPSGPLLAYVAGKLLSTAAPCLPDPPTRLLRAFGEFLTGFQGPFTDQAPVHPTVIARLGLGHLSPDTLYRRGHARLGFRQYTLDSIRWAPWFG